MNELTHTELADSLRGGGARIIGIVSRTDAQARKRNNPYGRIWKFSRAGAMIGKDYGRGVERLSGEEFTPDPLPWGEYVPGLENKVITYKGRLYLAIGSNPKARALVPPTVEYHDDNGTPLTYDEVKDLIRKPSVSKKQEAVGIEGVENQEWRRAMAMDSILEVQINGERFKLVPDPR